MALEGKHQFGAIGDQRVTFVEKKIDKERMERQLGAERPFVYRKLDRQTTGQKKAPVSPFRKKVEPISGDFVIENDLDVPTFIRKKG